MSLITEMHADGTILRQWENGEQDLSVEQLTGLPIPDLPADPDLIPPDPTRLRSPR